MSGVCPNPTHRREFETALKALERKATPPTAPTCDKIRAACDKIRDLLLEKNKAYGDSALDPVRVFSKADKVEGLKVRIDDKLSRLARGAAAGEDVIDDLIGYLIMLKIATQGPIEVPRRETLPAEGQ